jgi:hypothetical protein
MNEVEKRAGAIYRRMLKENPAHADEAYDEALTEPREFNRMRTGDIVRYSRPANPEEEKMRFVVIEGPFDDPPRVLVELLDSNMSIVPTFMYPLDEVAPVKKTSRHKKVKAKKKSSPTELGGIR